MLTFMNTPLRILHLEDNSSDALLARKTLEESGVQANIQTVTGEEEFVKALSSNSFDLVLADYNLPGYGGVAALEHVQANYSELPFIFVSGCIGEDVAIELLKKGATDFVLKDRLGRLGLAVNRAIDQVLQRVERQKAQEEVRKSRDYYLTLFDKFPALIWRANGSGECDYFNSTWLAFTGRSLEQELHGGWSEGIHPEDFAQCLKVYSESMARREAFVTEYRLRRSDGQYRWVTDHGRPFFWLDGEFIGYVGVCMDIHDRWLMAEALRESRNRFEQVSDHVGEWIWEVDAHGLYTYSNNVVSRILGYQAEELVGKLHFYDLFPVEQRQALKTAVFEHFNKGIPFVKHLNACQHKNGEVLVIETSGTPIFDNDHKLLGYRGVDTNMTERKRIEAEIFRSQRLESIGRLAGGIAHDLNNVLAPIIMAVPLLRDEITGETSQPLLEIIESNARRGAAIVRQVLAFAKGAEIQQTAVQPAFLLEEMAKIISETFPKSIELRTKIAPNLIQINGDPTQLHQVLMNLCVNARDAMPEGGVLTLTAENVELDDFALSTAPQAQKSASYVLITVADTGMGISQDNLPKIFDPFFSTKGPHSGTGLGLSSVMGIIKSHSGFIQVHSQPGQGTQFKIYLPVDTSSAMAFPKEEFKSLPVANGETILVVDDEPNVVDVLRQILERQGYRVLCASDGTEAVTLYARHGTDIKVVITDMLMPFMDGTATIRALLKMNPAVKIIAASGMVPQPGLGDVLTLGVKTFLRKPFTNDTLLQVVRDVMTQS